jgi:hypothetical protein
MKTLAVLAIGLWLAAGRALPVGAQPTLPQGPPDRPCDQPLDAAEAGKPAGHAAMATIQGVDHQRGTLELATKDGQFVVTTTPAATEGLRAGDQLLICLEGDAIKGEERLAD